jgi:hypothetical protein
MSWCLVSAYLTLRRFMSSQGGPAVGESIPHRQEEADDRW